MNTSEMIVEIQQVRQNLINHVNTRFNLIIARLEGQEITPADYETALVVQNVKLSADPSIFVGVRPVAVLFGGERIAVKSWTSVYKTVLQRCNREPVYHDRLMQLRGKLSGSVRVFLADRPDNMKRPLKIDDDLYAESHYGSQGMMHILVHRILAAVHYDYSNISVDIR